MPKTRHQVKLEELKLKIKTLEEQLEAAKNTETVLRELLTQRDAEISELKDMSNTLPYGITPETSTSGTSSSMEHENLDVEEIDNSSNSSYEETLDEDDNQFKITEEDLAKIKIKANGEIDRLIQERESWMSKNPNHAGKFPKPGYAYRISQFVSEVMRKGFTDEYLSTRKLTEQDAKKGKNDRIAMHPDEVHKVEQLCYKVWRKVPTIYTSKDESKKEIKGAIRRSMRTVLSNRRPNKTGSSL